MQRTLIGLILSLLLLPQARGAGDSFTLSAEQWALPRSGSALIHLAPIRDAMADWLATPDAHMVIQYSGSDTTNLWAGELQDWLVALGIPADHIDKHVSADQAEDALTLLVRR
ncbi:MAG TPA: hypothetical protein VGN70_01160 [Gammaproteobacteria bacterium]|jgi:hypothetical protein